MYLDRIERQAKQLGLGLVIVATGDKRLYRFSWHGKEIATARNRRDAQWFLLGWRAKGRMMRQARQEAV